MSSPHKALPVSGPIFLLPQLRAFTTIWLGQLVSLFGSGLTSFALGLWVFQKTGSVTQYALITLSAVVPRLLAGPLAGALVDRWDRRRTMLLSDLAAGLCSLAVAGLLFTGRLEVWHIYLAVSCAALAGTFQVPAYAASISLLVPAKELGRANGLVQLSQSVADVFAPLAAGVLLLAIQIQGVILIDFLTFLVAAGSLLAVRIPGAAHPGGHAHPAALRALLGEAREGWRFISSQAGLRGLMFFTAVFNFQWGMVGVLAAPLVLGFSNPAGLGTLLTVAGCGMLAGSLVMSAWGGPRRKVLGILAAEGCSGLGFLLIGLQPSLALTAVGAFGAHCTIAVIAGSNRTLWQRKVPPAMQGRVFAFQEMIAHAAAPLAILAAGPLAERLFEPLLAEHGPLAGSLGQLLGAGPGRGIGLMFVILGLIQAAAALAGAAYRPLRELESSLPRKQGR